MRIQAESTDIICNLEGVEVRVWNAITESGEQLFLFVHRVATRADLGDELVSMPAPSDHSVQNVR